METWIIKAQSEKLSNPYYPVCQKNALPIIEIGLGPGGRPEIVENNGMDQIGYQIQSNSFVRGMIPQ